MKVVLISSGVLPVPPVGYGGLEQVVSDLAICLDDMGHEVHVIAPTESEVGKHGNIKLIDCGPCMADARGWESQAFQKYAQMLLSDEFKDAIIHDHTWAKPVYLLKRDYPRLNVCSTLHGMLPYETPPPVDKPNMIGISKHHAKSISEGLGIETKFVYNGVDLGKYSYNLDRCYSDPYLFLARMTPFKGAHVFIELMKRTGFEGNLVGDDTMVESKEYVMQLMKACDEYPEVKYRGGVDRDKAIYYFQTSKCYILPCQGGWQEPFGLTVIESMACGCPVVATPSGAIPELVVDKVTGFIAKDNEDLYEILKSGKIDSIKPKDCRERAEEFSREKMATNYLKLYEEILNGRGW